MERPRRASCQAMARYPCIRQHDHNDCGPAVLATVAKHYGLPLGIGRVRELCRSDAMGTNLLGLMKGAETIGFAAKAAKGPYEALLSPQMPVPFIVHVLDEIPGLATMGLLGHFSVVCKATEKYVDIADPARGSRRMPREEFEKKWTGALMLLVPTPKLAGVRASLPSWRR